MISRKPPNNPTMTKSTFSRIEKNCTSLEKLQWCFSRYMWFFLLENGNFVNVKLFAKLPDIHKYEVACMKIILISCAFIFSALFKLVDHIDIFLWFHVFFQKDAHECYNEGTVMNFAVRIVWRKCREKKEA